MYIYGSGGGVNFQYTYDDNGNIISKKFNHRTGTPANVYTYDALNRVTNGSYVYTTGSEQFNYDLLGNRDSVVDTRSGGGTTNYTHNTANEYTTIGGTNVTHDSAGNLQTDTAGYTYHYDHDNRLVTIKKNNDTTLVADYTYDALGRRIEKVDTVAGKTTRYYYDAQRIVLEEQTSQGSTAYRWFVYGNYIDEALMYEWQIGQQNTRFYFGHDHLYSPVVMFTNTGTVMERYEYDAYGKVRIMNANYVNLNYSLLGNTYFFTGRELDTLDAGNCTLMYYRARYYDPQTGRFLQRDPAQYIDGMNLYEYVQSEPVINFDPFGNLMTLAPPANFLKCQLVDCLISNAAVMPINEKLWGYYKSGKGGVLEMSCEDFDKGGDVRSFKKNAFKAYIFNTFKHTAKALPCNNSKTYTSSDRDKGDATSGLDGQMISDYKIRTDITITVEKVCKSNCCSYVQANVRYDFWFRDRTDFNKDVTGKKPQTFTIPGVAVIHDQLVRDCNLGKDFQIYASCSDSETWKASCN